MKGTRGKKEEIGREEHVSTVMGGRDVTVIYREREGWWGIWGKGESLSLHILYGSERVMCWVGFSSVVLHSL